MWKWIVEIIGGIASICTIGSCVQGMLCTPSTTTTPPPAPPVATVAPPIAPVITVQVNNQNSPTYHAPPSAPAPAEAPQPPVEARPPAGEQPQPGARTPEPSPAAAQRGGHAAHSGHHRHHQDDDDEPVAGACAEGIATCDPAHPCGTDLRHSVEHCGGCGRTCDLPHASPRCDGGQCRIGACDRGFQSGNGRDDDGCEERVDLQAGADRVGVIRVAAVASPEGRSTRQVLEVIARCAYTHQDSDECSHAARTLANLCASDSQGDDVRREIRQSSHATTARGFLREAYPDNRCFP